MDPISYGVAAKQKQRIEKVIAEPDSESGVITVPQVIAAGETITIPAGRVAVLPNVQVDGTLNVEGEVFIPSGASFSKTAEVIKTIADLKTITGTNAEVLGYHTAGDGGGGLFYWDSTLTEEDNGGTIIQATGVATGRWKRIFSGMVNVKWFGAVGNNITDDTLPFQSAIDYCDARGLTLYIPTSNYLFTDRLIVDGAMNIKSDATACMRWQVVTPTVNNIGILFDYEGVFLCDIELPKMLGNAINSSFVYPGYTTNNPDLTQRIGNAVHLKGGDRINVKVHTINGFGAGYFGESTASWAQANINININTIDLCERGIALNSTAGKGFSQVVAVVNTCFAKFPISLNARSGYINASRFTITGTAFTNEIGGCGILILGTGVQGCTFDINELQAGYREDSPSDTPVLLTPSGTMSATPIQGEMITQAESGATGIVVTNADYTLGTTIPFTVRAVNGKFNTSGQLTGSTSGALGVGSVPSSVRGLVCPFIAGDQTSNGVSYDAEQTGTLGYSGATHCVFNIGFLLSHPTGAISGAFSVYPVKGESVRVRDVGNSNNIKIVSPIYLGLNRLFIPIPLTSTLASPGESNFNGGVGSAQWGQYIYCTIDFSSASLAAGANISGFLYHSVLSSITGIHPIDVIPRNEGLLNNKIELVAFNESNTENRRIRVKIYNRGTSAFTGTITFFVKAY